MFKNMFFSKTAVFFILINYSKNALGVDNRKFPSNFKFGVATAAYQVEGAWNEDGKGENIWDHLVHEHTDYIKDQSNGDIACDSYHKTDTDIGLLEELGVDYYRFSISWSRILPTGYVKDGINELGVAYYNDLLTKLQDNGIEPMVTLYHWDLPEQLEDFGGWLNETIVDVFTDYARVAFELFGDKIKIWTTFNEPYIVCDQGYETGQKAPAKTDNPGVDCYLCAHNLLKSHAAAYHLYDEEFRKTQNGKISIVLNTNWFEPNSDDEIDKEASERSLQFTFGWFANPIVHGNYPQVMIDRIADRSAKEGFEKSRLPEFTSEEIDYIKGTYDYLGLNHYSTSMAIWTEDAEIGTPSWSNDLSTGGSLNMTWECAPNFWLCVVPWGMRKITNWIKVTYNNPEVVVTENGFSDSGLTLDDEVRVNYYRDYLSYLLEAIYDDGVNVTGYTAWSFMDNFEWLSGYTEKYGLYSVNFTDPDRPRIPKASAKYYQSVLKTKCLVSDCVEN